jgi:hypothetical protein
VRGGLFGEHAVSLKRPAMSHRRSKHRFPRPLRTRLRFFRDDLFRHARRILRISTVNEQRAEYVLSRIEGQRPTPEQGMKLIRMTGMAFGWIRARSSDPVVVHAIADAFHNMPGEMFHHEFSWSRFLGMLECLERQVPDVGAIFLAAFDDIVGFTKPLTTKRDGSEVSP